MFMVCDTVFVCVRAQCFYNIVGKNKCDGQLALSQIISISVSVKGLVSQHAFCDAHHVWFADCCFSTV